MGRVRMGAWAARECRQGVQRGMRTVEYACGHVSCLDDCRRWMSFCGMDVCAEAMKLRLGDEVKAQCDIGI